MKRIVATVVVEVEDDVDPVHVRDMLRNCLWMAFEELKSGRAYWKQARVSAMRFGYDKCVAGEKPVEDRA